MLERLCGVFLRRYCHLAVHGVIPDFDRPMLICANHRSHLDTLAVIAALGLSFEDCAVLAAKDYFFPGAGWLRLAARKLRLVPVERRPRAHDFAQTTAACAEALATGTRALLAYPEGTRGTGRSPAPFKRGPALLALDLGLPILPVYIAGTERVLPKGQRFPAPGQIDVVIGAALPPPAAGGRAERRVQSIALTRRTEAQIAALAATIAT